MANQHSYPPIEPFETGTLQVDEPHKLYWEQCGNPEGDPILFLHGGPGAGCTEFDRCLFDPEYFRIVLFDQRGSGMRKYGNVLEFADSRDASDHKAVIGDFKI